MRTEARKILILYKTANEKAHQLGREILQWLKERDFECVLAQAGKKYDEFLNKPSYAIVLGGDGTILEVARYFIGSDTIILGINFGRVGFLAASEPDNWTAVISEALQHPEKARKCLALNWGLEGKNNNLKGVAANDLVVSHGKMARLVNLALWVDDQSMGNLRSDGLIFFSPLGSSGYNYSAGGPIVHPEINVLGVTPICPFMSSSASLVFPAGKIFRLIVANDSPECYLTVDGQINFKVYPGDLLSVKGFENAIRLWGNDKKYIERLAES